MSTQCQIFLTSTTIVCQAILFHNRSTQRILADWTQSRRPTKNGDHHSQRPISISWMPFGLKNASNTFQCVMNEVFGGVYQTCLFMRMTCSLQAQLWQSTSKTWQTSLRESGNITLLCWGAKAPFAQNNSSFKATKYPKMVRQYLTPGYLPFLTRNCRSLPRVYKSSWVSSIFTVNICQTFQRSLIPYTKLPQ